MNRAGWDSILIDCDHEVRSTIEDDDYEAESSSHVRPLKPVPKNFYTCQLLSSSAIHSESVGAAGVFG